MLIQRELEREPSAPAKLAWAFFALCALSPLARVIAQIAMVKLGQGAIAELSLRLVRHTLVGIGEATFVTIAPTFVADLFSESKRGRILGVFYLAIPVGSAAGYLLGSYLAPSHGWRFPFYIAAAPGFVLAISVLFLREPQRGQNDSVHQTPQSDTILGLAPAAGSPA